MKNTFSELVKDLNNENVSTRLESLQELANLGDLECMESKEYYINNHIHTFYSFSPYSPAKAVYMSCKAGLKTAGIMDHDSISGAREFIEAGKIAGIATTIGIECRVDFSNTLLKGRRFNNPDQVSIAYMALHGIPHTMIDKVNDFFAPYREKRNKRNILMTEKIAQIMQPFGIKIDFQQDVVPLSKMIEGGSITERHILFALSNLIIEKFGKGEGLIKFLQDSLKINISSKLLNYLKDASNEHYSYDLLGVLKSDMVPLFYIDAADECPDVREVIDFSKSIGAVSAYAYLGDVGESVTGDKKTQKFEDAYLDELFEVLKSLKYDAITYMPSRNTIDQIRRLKNLCDKHDFFQITGEDINTPRQSFICSAMENEEFHNLISSTWALIGHEKAATESLLKGMFSQDVISIYPNLNDRIKEYEKIGRGKL